MLHMPLKLYVVTVAHFNEYGTLDEICTFDKAYRSPPLALQALEDHCRDAWEMLVDPNSGDHQPFPGLMLKEGTEHTYNFELAKRGSTLELMITEVEVEDR